MVIDFQWFTFNKCLWIKYICQILLTRKNRENLKVPFFLHLWHFSVLSTQPIQLSTIHMILFLKCQFVLYFLDNFQILRFYIQGLFLAYIFLDKNYFFKVGNTALHTFTPNFWGEWHKKVEKCSSSGSLKLNLFFKFKSDQLSTFLTSV